MFRPLCPLRIRCIHHRSFASSAFLSRADATTSVETKKNPKRNASKPPRNLLEETKLQEYLDHIAKTKDISITDLEREYKPFQRPNKDAHNFEGEYNKLLARLVRSFSVAQLRSIAKLYDLALPAKLSKPQVAATIIESEWRWPSLTKIKQEQRDAEIIHETFLLNAKQAFLILGKDGADLLDMSSKFGVHVSFSSNPLSLKVEGSRGSLQQLGIFLGHFKMNIKERHFRLPSQTNVGPDTLQRISRMSGVFAENSGEGEIHLTFKNGDERAANLAERLIFRAANEVEESNPALVYSTPSQTQPSLEQALSPYPTYALYPFQPLQPGQDATRQKSLFRARRVEDWLRSGAQDINSSNLTGQVMDFSGNLVDLRQALLPFATATDGHSRSSVSASFGHLLFSAASSPSSITPPVPGSHQLSKLLEWFQLEKPKRIFTPSLPRKFANCAPSQQRLIHRLIYRPPSHLNKYDGSGHIIENLKFELVLEQTTPASEVSEPGQCADDQPQVSLAPTCWSQSLHVLDLLLPDRSMDLRFSVTHDRTIPDEDWPTKLRAYLSDLQAFLTTTDVGPSQPEIPLVIRKGDTEYQLSASSTVRQQLNPIPNSDGYRGSSFHTVVESILELEHNQRSRICQVTCPDITSDDSWEAFLNHCYELTTSLPMRQPPPNPPI